MQPNALKSFSPALLRQRIPMIRGGERSLAVSEFVETNPQEAWEFADRWSRADDEDLRQAIATRLLEHLRDHRFEHITPLVEQAVRQSERFAGTISTRWRFGECLSPGDARRFARLLEKARKAG